MNKVPGTENPADMGTKGLNGELIEKFVRMVNMEHKDGRSDLAPDLNKLIQKEKCKRSNSTSKFVTKKVKFKNSASQIENEKKLEN